MTEEDITKKDRSGLLLTWRVYFAAAALFGIIALALLLLGYSNAGGLLSSISLPRIVIFLFILAAFCFSVILFLASWFSINKVNGVILRLGEYFDRDKTWCIAALALLLFTLSCVFLITLIPEVGEPFTYAILLRMFPLLVLFSLLSGLSLLVLVYSRFRGGFVLTFLSNKLFVVTLLVFLFIFISWAWVARTILISEAQATGLNPLGAPILDTQVFVAWLSGMLILLLILYIIRRRDSSTFLKRIKPYHLDISVGGLLWLATAILWLSIPIYSNWFISVPRLPNHAFYPASDAFGYDSASQFLLVGEGFVFGGTPFVRRPLHALFVAFLHVLGGQDYVSVVFVQVIILAALPTLFYLLVTVLHNRVTGAMAAVLIMLREANSIAISGSVTTSHAKMLMADLPATCTIVLFTLLTVVWLKKYRQSTIYPLVAGGVLALSVLIRFEAIMFIFVVFFISIFVIHLKQNFHKWLLQMGLFVVGLVLVLSPWVWRNYQITGTIFIDSPTFRFDVIKARYKTFVQPAEPPAAETERPVQEMPTEPAPQQQPESVSLFNKAVDLVFYLMPEDTFISSAMLQAIEFISANPSKVVGFITTHYLNSQIQPVIYFPTTTRIFDSLIGFAGHRSPAVFWEECCSVQNYIRRMPYWRKWLGVFPQQAFIPILINIIFIALGISTAWKRNKLVGLMPLIMSMFYFAVNALFRNSGGRYILPVDWVGILYFSIGLSFVSVHCYRNFSGRQIPDRAEYLEMNPSDPSAHANGNLLVAPGFYGALVGLFLIGAILPVTEKAVQPRYTQNYNSSLIDEFFNSDILNDEQLETINQFINQGGEVTVGRAMYPRFFPAYQGEEAHEETFDPRTYPYLGFFVVGPVSKFGVLPVEDFQGNFPNASDVLVVGCPGEEGSVFAVGVFDDSGSLQTIVVRSPMPPDLTCPLEEPVPGSEDL